MFADYVILAIITVLAISGGVFLLFQAKNYHARHSHSVTALKGLVRKPDSPVSIASMNEAIAAHGAKRDAELEDEV